MPPDHSSVDIGSPHPRTTQLIHYATGRLDPERARRVWSHCEACGRCAARLMATILLRVGDVDGGIAEPTGNGARGDAI